MSDEIKNSDDSVVESKDGNTEAKDDNKTSKNVESSQFKEKAAVQVNKILKDIATISFQGSKSHLTEEQVNDVITELRNVSNVAKKQFSMSVDKKDSNKFGDVKQSVTKTIREIKTLGDLAEKHSGEFSEEHIKIIFDTLKKTTSELKKSLSNKDKKDETFKF